MTLSLDELTTPLSRQEVQASIYHVLGALGVNTTSWKPGAVVRTMIVGVSLVLSAFSQLQALIAKSGFLELSEGDWLTLVAHYVYDVDRLEATFATGEVILTNGGGGVYDEDPDDLIVTSSTTGKTYRNTAAFHLGASGTVTVPIAATEAGIDSTAGPTAIDTMVTSLLGVTVSNPAALVGTDAELDPALRTRCSEKLGALSPMGPWDAYAFAARNATRADGGNVGVTRVRVRKDGYGNVTTYVATATGALETADLAVVDEAIQQLAGPLAVTATTLSADPLGIEITYELWMYDTSGRTSAQVQTLVSTRLATFMASQPIGGNVIDPDPGHVFTDALAAAIESTLSEIFHVVVTVPVVIGVSDATGYVVTIGQVPVLAAEPIATIHQVPPAEGRA